jgi:light-independent protochlorophyllide reductase subunit B
MEDHLLEIFGGHDTTQVVNQALSNEKEISWSKEALLELEKIPGFIRGKIKRNTEIFAIKNNLYLITLEVIYAAKEFFSN